MWGSDSHLKVHPKDSIIPSLLLRSSSKVLSLVWGNPPLYSPALIYICWYWQPSIWYRPNSYPCVTYNGSSSKAMQLLSIRHQIIPPGEVSQQDRRTHKEEVRPTDQSLYQFGTRSWYNPWQIDARMQTHERSRARTNHWTCFWMGELQNIMSNDKWVLFSAWEFFVIQRHATGTAPSRILALFSRLRACPLYSFVNTNEMSGFKWIPYHYSHSFPLLHVSVASNHKCFMRNFRTELCQRRLVENTLNWNTAWEIHHKFTRHVDGEPILNAHGLY